MQWLISQVAEWKHQEQWLLLCIRFMDVTNNHDGYDSTLIDPIMPLAIAGLLLPKFCGNLQRQKCFWRVWYAHVQGRLDTAVSPWWILAADSTRISQNLRLYPHSPASIHTKHLLFFAIEVTSLVTQELLDIWSQSLPLIVGSLENDSPSINQPWSAWSTLERTGTFNHQQPVQPIFNHHLPSIALNQHQPSLPSPSNEISRYYEPNVDSWITAKQLSIWPTVRH